MSNDIQFYQTRMGRQFYEVTVPELIRQIARLNDLLALAVEVSVTKPEDKTDDRARQD
ncbi:MAG: hypothetical protein IH621_01475 [Krumholzibacteria bacterium]|nr:hypothetical protein [Candidatus Krumholzibacteria bacterium]